MYGGRWNRPGLAVLYTSQARSLAMLELIVHFSSKRAFSLPYEFAHLHLDDKHIVDMQEDLKDIDLYRPNNPLLWKITDEYFTQRNVLCLKVPSVLVPKEYNYLLNPAHPGYPDISIIGFEPVLFDDRYGALF